MRARELAELAVLALMLVLVLLLLARELLVSLNPDVPDGIHASVG